jgi:hypothetical protein
MIGRARRPDNTSKTKAGGDVMGKAGPPDAEIAAVFQQIFQASFDNLKTLLERGIATTSGMTGEEKEWIGRTR